MEMKSKTVEFGGIDFEFRAEESWSGVSYRWFDFLITRDGRTWRISDTACRIDTRIATTFRLAAEQAMQMQAETRSY